MEERNTGVGWAAETASFAYTPDNRIYIPQIDPCWEMKSVYLDPSLVCPRCSMRRGILNERRTQAQGLVMPALRQQRLNRRMSLSRRCCFQRSWWRQRHRHVPGLSAVLGVENWRLNHESPCNQPRLPRQSCYHPCRMKPTVHDVALPLQTRGHHEMTRWTRFGLPMGP